MKSLKTYYVCAALTLALASCSTQKMPTTLITSYDKLPLKNTPLSENDLKRWSHLDLIKDTVPGMSVDKAYAELLKGKKPKQVVVAVVDSGIDINHPDLAANIWNNPKEVAGNGIDDDKNNYVDDVHGWNFLGDSDRENMEYVRILKKGDDGSAEYKRAKAEHESDMAEAMQGKMQVDFITKAIETLQKETKKETLTVADINAINSKDSEVNAAKETLSRILGRVSFEDLKSQVNSMKDHYYGQLNGHLNLQLDGRKVVGDNPNDIKDTKYGNNNVVGPIIGSAKHGTHVSGIIAQTRGNDLGGDGVADGFVKIMAVRAVPDGDEYDKDIALAIRYAADNGAKVINGSFGKYYSPNKEWVQDALKYAESKDVLVIFAAGNDSKDLDVINKYPSDSYDGKPATLTNVMIIGALNPSYGSDMVASFSNYGAENVDVFAPGAKIYATTPENTYEYLQGTSMASPNAAGVAAMVRAYYPSLTAAEVKQVLMESGITLTQDIKVGERKIQKPFNTVSKSGKIINAYNAIILADKMAKKKK